MDGFDDLLAPSRSILEENPFEDPFAKPRSGSPDPWSSFGQQHTPPSHSDIDYFKSGFEDQPSTTQASGSYFTSDHGHGEPSAVATPADPLDAATVTVEDLEDEQGITHSDARHETTTLRAPGFGIFTSSTDNLSQTAVGPESDSPLHSKSPSIPSGDDTGAADTSLLHAEGLATSSQLPCPQEPVPSGTSPERAIVSPLDQQPPPNIDCAFASLALGGESLGGWQTGWGGEDQVAASTVSALAATANDDDDDDDDDTPIGQTARFRNAGSPQPSGHPTVSRHGEGPLPPLFVISVEDPQKVGDPIRAHTLYTVHTRTSSPLFSRASFSVLRRYSDFLWLYETLSMNNPGVVVPPVPEKNSFGRFDEQFIQQRRSALEKCIQKMANHPVLCKDADLRFFLENDNFALDIKQRKAEMAHEKGGLMASIGQTLTGPRFHETDEWFDKQRTYLDGLESQLRGLVKSIEIVAKQRVELASATGEFAMTVAELSLSDLGEQLQQTLGALANVEQAAAEAQSVQSQQDMMTLMSTGMSFISEPTKEASHDRIADEYSRLINSVRLAFNSRVRTYTSWQNADAEVRRARQMHERARAQGRLPTERVGHTVSLVTEAERRALDARHEFDQCSRLIKSEMARFERERVDDLKDALQTFLNGMISRQTELITAWENYQQMLLKGVAGGKG